MNPIIEPVRPLRGGRVRGQMFTADITGNIIDDITDAMESATVSYKWNDLIPGTLDCSFRGRDVVSSIEQCLVPVLTVDWIDATGVEHHVSERLGLFFFLPPDRNVTYAMDVSTVQAFDATWALNQITLDQSYTITKDSAFMGDWAATFALGRTNLNMEFPKTDKRPDRKTTYFPNEPVLPIINELYSRAGYWPVVSLPNHPRFLITSPGKRDLIGTQEPARIISSAAQDIIGEVRIQPKREEFANQVYIASNSSDADPTMRDGYKATLTDPNSPFSIQNLGYIVSISITDNMDEDFDTQRQRALSILERSSSMNTRLIVPVWPDPRITPHEGWVMDIRKMDGTYVSQSMWNVEEMTFGFTADSAAQIVTATQLADMRTVQ